jgi:hypothetical protein
MKVQIIATRDCRHRPNLERELGELDIAYELIFVEDRPELAQRLDIRHSPNLIVDDRVVFRGQPSEADLRDYFLGRR